MPAHENRFGASTDHFKIRCLRLDIEEVCFIHGFLRALQGFQHVTLDVHPNYRRFAFANDGAERRMPEFAGGFGNKVHAPVRRIQFDREASRMLCCT